MLTSDPAGIAEGLNTLFDQAENSMYFVGRHVPDLVISITPFAQIRFLTLRDDQREPGERYP